MSGHALNPARADLSPEHAECEGQDFARERCVHGLLEMLHRDTPAEIDRRVRGVLDMLGAPIPMRRHRFAWRALSALAAAVALASLVIVGLSSNRSALAMVQASIEAARTGGDHRYEIRVALGDQATPIAGAAAVFDVRDADHYLFRVTADNGEVITLGHDAQGPWAIKRTGEIDRTPPAWLLSHWTSFGSGTVVLMTVDDILSGLRASYDLQRTAGATLASGLLCERITATRRGGESADADRVELWLDPRTHLAERIEMHWAGNPDAPIVDERPPDGPGRPSRDGRPPPDGPRGGRPPGDRSGPIPRPPNLTRLAASPRTAVFELVEAAPFAAGWFEPEMHQAK